MSDASRHDAWQGGNSYDFYMGRWSRRIAPRFLTWLDPAEGLDWLEVGCGTGALTAAILAECRPKSVLALDPSQGFLAGARAAVTDARVRFQQGDAQALPVADDCIDVIASALVLNFVPDREKALSEMKRVARPGGTLAFYVWDYPGGGVEFVRAFWNAATELDPAARQLTEDRRFPFCTAAALTALARGAGLVAVICEPIEEAAVFQDFEDFWRPFTLGAGPAPGYYQSLDAAAQGRLRDRLDESLPREEDGTLSMKLRAWAVRARCAKAGSS